MQQNKISKHLDTAIFWVYVIFFLTIICSFRGITSIAIGLIIVLGLARNKLQTGLLFNKHLLSPFLCSCIALFLLECLSMMYTKDQQIGLKHVRIESGLLLVPLAVYSTGNFLNRERRKELMAWFTILLTLASVFCFISAYLRFLAGAPSTTFFYHALVSPFLQHAIQYSILVFIGLVSLFQAIKSQGRLIKGLQLYLLIAFLSFFLLLLASKLIIIFYLLYLAYFFWERYRSDRPGRRWFYLALAPVLGIFIWALSTNNPIERRFREIWTGDIEFINREKFSQGDYFNGLQFRLLQFRFVNELLNEHQGWVKGLTPGDAQAYLDQKYIQMDMYTGKPGEADHGFLGFHTHNQFLQCLLQNGLPGLVIFALICFFLLQMAIKRKDRQLSVITVVLLVYCFTDAVLESQYGLILFTFFPPFHYLSSIGVIEERIVSDK
jgi:O-antigen ligase